MKRNRDPAWAESRSAAESPRPQEVASGPRGHMRQTKNKLLLIGQGALAAVISSVCCLLPAVALAIGLSGGLTTALVSLGRFRLYGLLLGLGFVALASYFFLRWSRSCCSEAEYRRRQVIVPLTMLASFGAIYALIVYFVVPILYKLT